MSHFGNIGHHLIVAIIDIYRPYTQWLGDVQWGHLMTPALAVLYTYLQRENDVCRFLKTWSRWNI